VQIDGGRTRIRGDLRAAEAAKPCEDEEAVLDEKKLGRSRKQPRRTFDGDWREPKLVTIFVHDAQGRMEKKSSVWVEGTFQGPDALAELVAMHLHRLGAARALSITFVSDGAVWIWDRLEMIVKLAQLEGVKIYEVLDCHHATHHISLALGGLGLPEKERVEQYLELRTQLRNGRWVDVVYQLRQLAGSTAANASVWTEIAYLRKHGQAGRLKYPTFRGHGLPLGSGAIESHIRRVVNLRMKGNSMYWREENAEAMLQLRALVITNRWDERMLELREFHSRTRKNDWHWQARDMAAAPERATQSSA
jgi:hypothetical protein